MSADESKVLKEAQSNINIPAHYVKPYHIAFSKIRLSLDIKNVFRLHNEIFTKILYKSKKTTQPSGTSSDPDAEVLFLIVFSYYLRHRVRHTLRMRGTDKIIGLQLFTAL